MIARILGFFLTIVAGVLGLTVPAAAIDGVLYELTESVKLSGHGGHFKTSASTLAGSVRAGTPLCPTWLAQRMSISECGLIVRAVGRADDVTGVGPASGEIDVVVQDGNTTDPPENVVMRGRFEGSIDLSEAFGRPPIPIGSINGRFSMAGLHGTVMAGTTVRGGFRGTFRLPFMHEGRPSYLMDDHTFVPVLPSEMSLGSAMVRLEFAFTSSAPTPAQ